MLDDLLLRTGSPIREALAAITSSALGIVFVVDEKRRLKGVATDGDIRRGLLAGAGLQDAVDGVMKTEAVSLPVETDTAIIHQKLSSRVRLIPLLDNDGRVVDYASAARHGGIPVAAPSLDGNELDYLADCVRTGWISSQGPYLARFEHAFADFLGVEHVVSTSNGTTALHLALLALGIGPGDEVIVPNLTFAASATSVIHAGARPVLVDVEPETWTIDPDQVAAAITSRTKAVMPVHLYGQPALMDPLLDVATRHGLIVVEDAAEALGSRYKGRLTGTFGAAATFSFFANKMITTGEGGMVVFRDRAQAEHARRLRDHGMQPNRRYWHTEIGFNYRMTNMQAAVGLAQMERIETFIAAKLDLARRYREALAGVPGVLLPIERPDVLNTYWAFSLLLSDVTSAEARDRAIARLARIGIGTRPLFYPLHHMPPFEAYGANRLFPISERLSMQGLSLPSANSLTSRETAYICQSIRHLLEGDGLLIAD